MWKNSQIIAANVVLMYELETRPD